MTITYDTAAVNSTVYSESNKVRTPWKPRNSTPFSTTVVRSVAVIFCSHDIRRNRNREIYITKWWNFTNASGGMHHLAICLFLIFSAVPKHRLKFRTNVQLCDLVYKMFLGVPTSKTSFHNATECTIKRPRFQIFLSSSNFQNMVLNCDKLRH